MSGGSVNLNSHTRIRDARPLTVAFDAASYEVPLSTGGLPNYPRLGEEGDREVVVTVEMTPAPSLRAVSIPVTVTAEPAVSGYGLQYERKPSFDPLNPGSTPEWSGADLLPALGAQARSTTHSDLDWTTRYRYQLRASNRQGDGAWSAHIPNSNGVRPPLPRLRVQLLEPQPIGDLWRVVVDCPPPSPCDQFSDLVEDEVFRLEGRIGTGTWSSLPLVLAGGASGASGASSADGFDRG